MNRKLFYGLLAPLVAAVAAVLVSSIALLISDNSPATAFLEMWKQIDSTESVVSIVNRAVPYYIAGVAVAVGFKMNLFNIGVNGQYVLAALLAAAVGAAVSLPAPLHVALIIGVAVVTGMMWAAIPALLKVTRNVNEVISTIMLNYVATNLVAYLLKNHFDRGTGMVAETARLEPSARIPSLNTIVEATGFNFSPGVILQGFLPVAILLGVGYHLLLNRSRFGFDLRISGQSPTAARSSGVNPKRMVMITMMLSGAIAGLVGMAPLMADPQYHKFGDQFPTEIGFTGLSLALLGRNHPVGIAAAAIVWATIERATQRLSFIDIPQEIGTILQGSFLLAAVIAYEVVRRRADEAETRAMAQRIPVPPSAAPTAGAVP